MLLFFSSKIHNTSGNSQYEAAHWHTDLDKSSLQWRTVIWFLVWYLRKTTDNILLGMCCQWLNPLITSGTCLLDHVKHVFHSFIFFPSSPVASHPGTSTHEYFRHLWTHSNCISFSIFPWTALVTRGQLECGVDTPLPTTVGRESSFEFGRLPSQL